MTSSLRLRQYRPNDHNRVLELHEKAMRAVGGYVDGVPEPDLDDITNAYFDQSGEFLVGEIDDCIIAMGAFRPVTGYITEFLEDLPDATAEIKRMRVDPTYQRHGYGQAIYDELEERARELGFTDLVLDTTAQQSGAQRFFEQNSFEKVRTERVQPGDHAFELVFYRKSLTESVQV